MTATEDKKWIEQLRKGQNAYIYDDFEEIVIKFTPDKDRTAFVKRKGQPEYVLPQSTKIVYDAKCGGQLVDENFYNNFK